MEYFLEVSHELFDHRNFVHELSLSQSSSLVEILALFSEIFPDSIHEKQIQLFNELTIKDEEETEEEIHDRTALLQIKEMFPELGNSFVTVKNLNFLSLFVSCIALLGVNNNLKG